MSAPHAPGPPLGEGLAGKGVLVTGAVGGIGSAVAHTFAASGARVAALDPDQMTPREALEELYRLRRLAKGET